MREILFRGKRADNSEWVYGRTLSDDVIAPKGQMFRMGNGMYAEGLMGYVVDPATVGQYTGLTDKNGKKIFEGDIVSVEDHLIPKGKRYRFFDGTVEYKDASFAIVGEDFSAYRWIDYDIEVIGNIHDNPELLQGDNDAEIS